MLDRYTGDPRQASAVKRRYWIGVPLQLALLVLCGVAVAKSTINGRHLLLIAAIWFTAVLASNQFGPFSFFLNLGKRNTAKIAVIYALSCLIQLFIFGWILPLAVGIYRIAVR